VPGRSAKVRSISGASSPPGSGWVGQPPLGPQRDVGGDPPHHPGHHRHRLVAEGPATEQPTDRPRRDGGGAGRERAAPGAVDRPSTLLDRWATLPPRGARRRRVGFQHALRGT
jgi:hypothetical protein